VSLNRRFRQIIEDFPHDKAAVPVVDMHLHMVDFIQHTDGLKVLLGAMQKANIEKTVAFGLPVRKKWEISEPVKPHYYLDDDSRCYYFASTDELLAEEYLKLDAEEKKRIAPTLCGFNPTDRLAVEYVEYMFSKYPFWRGVGEILCRHDDLTSLTGEETARINHPALFDVFAFCAERGLPVCVHENSTSAGHHDLFEYLHELKEALVLFPRTIFVWAHCGISRRVSHKQYFKMAGDMLRAHDNLYVDYSWVVYDDVICEHHQPKAHWLALTQEYSERIMIGSDLCGHFDLLGKTMARYNILLEMLPDGARERVARKNAEALWFSQ